MIVQPDVSELDRAARLIRSGRLVAFPTETVYGLGANATNEDAVRCVYAVKNRPWASPLIVHVPDEAMARAITADWPKAAHVLAARFWPGPLTLVLKKAPIIPDLVTAALDTVGIRIPNHPIALDLIRKAGVPVAAPSANRFSQLSPTTAQHVQDALGEDVELIIDGGPTRVGIESTVVSLWRHPPVILRPGMISQEDLERATGLRFEQEADLPKIMESPGMHARHYAPRTPFHVLERGQPKPQGRGRVIEMPWDAPAFAANLYSELHRADQEGWDWIAIENPPETPEWAGIRDRLRRASTTEA
jgi:L-threonylcarbamoyladenylate synthase